MKKFLCFTLILICQAFILKPCIANANDAMYGIYIAPRIGFHFTTMNGISIETINNTVGLDNYNNFIVRGGLALGYDFSKRFNIPIRSEVEFLAVNKMRDTQTINNKNITGIISLENKMYSIFSNTYYDFNTDSAFTPYVGLGIGGFFSKISGDFDLNENNNAFKASFPISNNLSFSCNTSAGISYAFKKNIRFDALYRIAFYNNASTSYNTQNNNINLEADLLMNQLFLIARLTF